jgi:hypothetical protein
MELVPKPVAMAEHRHLDDPRNEICLSVEATIFAAGISGRSL